jgi:hypothetical protein
MKWTASNTLKTIGAIILLLSISLPMSKCSVSVQPDPTIDSYTLSPSEGSKENASTREEKIYVLDHFEPSDPGSWISVLVFIWPLLLIGINRWNTYGGVDLTIRFLEPFFLAGSFFVVDFASTFFADRREIGAYVAFLAIALYVIGAVWSDILLYLKWKNDKRT